MLSATQAYSPLARLRTLHISSDDRTMRTPPLTNSLVSMVTVVWELVVGVRRRPFLIHEMEGAGRAYATQVSRMVSLAGASVSLGAIRT